MANLSSSMHVRASKKSYINKTKNVDQKCNKNQGVGIADQPKQGNKVGMIA